MGAAVLASILVSLSSQSAMPPRAQDIDALLDGCVRVYLDVGTSAGVQIRKIFQPERYPGAPVLPIFDRYLGKGKARRADHGLCVFGFEPSPYLTPRLQALERGYRDQGWRVRIFKEVAVGDKEGTATFTFWRHAVASMYASSVIQGQLASQPSITKVSVNSTVPVISMTDFITRVHARRMPPGSIGAVVIKLDTEGVELDIVLDLIKTQAICDIDFIYLEKHARFFQGQKRKDYVRKMKAWPRELKALNCSHKPIMLYLDDEAYALDDGARKVDWKHPDLAAEFAEELQGMPRAVASPRDADGDPHPAFARVT